MKTRTLLAATVALFAVIAAPAAAQNLTGAWQVESQTQRGTQNITLDLAQDGSELTGTVTISLGGRRGGGGGGTGAQTFDIDEGSVDGDAFSFAYTLSFNGNEVTFSASGTFDGDDMEGVFQGGRGGGRPFTGVRGG